MSNFIVSVISIILVAVAVFMSSYYGGVIWTKFQAESRAAKLINEAEQVNGTLAYYEVDQTRRAQTLNELVADPDGDGYDSYLTDIPEGGAYDQLLGTRWELVDSFIMAMLGKGKRPYTECMAMRRHYNLDAEKYCKNAVVTAAYCDSNHVGIDGRSCTETDNPHCLHYCFDSREGEPRRLENPNPYFESADPCCIDNEMGGPEVDSPIYLN